MLCCLMRVCVCQRRRCSFSRSTVLIVNGVCFLLNEPVRFRCFFCLIMEGDVAYFFVAFVYLRSLSFSPTVSLCLYVFLFFFFYTWLCVYRSMCHVFY